MCCYITTDEYIDSLSRNTHDDSRETITTKIRAHDGLWNPWDEHA